METGTGENSRIWKEAEAAGIDVSALIAKALKRKLPQIKELPKVREMEVLAIPESEQLKWWETTRGEIEQINGGNRAAIDAFYFRNLWRIKCSAYSYMRRNEHLKKIIGYEDLINQYYIDLASGLLKFGAWDKSIGKAMYHSFRYAAVGGIDEVYDVSFGVKAKDEESKRAELRNLWGGKSTDAAIRAHERSGESCSFGQMLDMYGRTEAEK